MHDFEQIRKNEWTALLEDAERRLGFNNGFKLLYSPWNTLSTAEYLFLSLNPGNAPEGIELRQISDERGITYIVEADNTKSPLTAQFNLMIQGFNLNPERFLVGVVAPFRSNNWREMSKEQKAGSLSLGSKFWAEILANSTIRRIVTVSAVARPRP